MRLHVAIAGWLHGLDPSGAGRRQRGLLGALAGKLHSNEQVTVLHGGSPPPEPPPGISFHSLPIPAAPTWRRILAERRHLARALEAIGSNVLDLASLPVPRGLPCPVVLTLHDLRDLGPFRRRPRFLTRLAMRSALRRVAHVLVPSGFTATELRAASGGLLPPFTIVPNGVEARFFAEPAAPSPDGPYLLHVGHLESRKNLLLLLSALGQLGERMPRAQVPRLKLVGADHGAASALRERAAMLELTGHVELLGVVGDARLPQLYAQAAAVLVPSLHEGFGLAALEGLAAGRPVLVADRGALPEVVGKAGVVLPGEDASAWASAIESLLHDDGGAAARRMRVERAREFTWDRVASQILEVWREAASA
jgi:glycosyltransferase involved in cell wall biosynthesis